MFTTGRIIFSLLFVTVFVGGMIWAYRKDIKTLKTHYKGSIYVLLTLLIVAIILVLFKGELRP